MSLTLPANRRKNGGGACRSILSLESTSENTFGLCQIRSLELSPVVSSSQLWHKDDVDLRAAFTLMSMSQGGPSVV